jgi:hypothetical protein
VSVSANIAWTSPDSSSSPAKLAGPSMTWVTSSTDIGPTGISS